MGSNFIFLLFANGELYRQSSAWVLMGTLCSELGSWLKITGLAPGSLQTVRSEALSADGPCRELYSITTVLRAKLVSARRSAR